ncbi:MAG: hypothetical protein SWY16_27110 [Cyanobacteriota bacterium]|nr:hypothetical protein [Cyanobacteriota bacterium]
MKTYNQAKEELGYADERAFRDALLGAGINPNLAAERGLTNAQIRKLPTATRTLEAAVPSQTESQEPSAPPSEGEPTVALAQVQAKLGVDAATMVRLCREFGLSENRPLAQSEAIALCELAMEVYGNQLTDNLSFIGERQALLFQQQQDTAYQLGYLQESTLTHAQMRGRLAAQTKNLSDREEEVRSAQTQVFSLLSQAGQQIERVGKSAAEAHREFCQELFA